LAGEKKKEVTKLVQMSYALMPIVSFIVIVIFLNSLFFVITFFLDFSVSNFFYFGV